MLERRHDAGEASALGRLDRGGVVPVVVRYDGYAEAFEDRIAAGRDRVRPDCALCVSVCSVDLPSIFEAQPKGGGPLKWASRDEVTK
jgi:hypothetical protein